MATEKICREISDYDLNFIVTKLELKDEMWSEDLIIVLSFDGNVTKIAVPNELEKDYLGIGCKLTVRMTAEKLSQKLRCCPIMYEITKQDKVLGTVRHEITDCFIESVKCTDFTSQTAQKIVEFAANGKDNGVISLCFHLQNKTQLEKTNKFLARPLFQKDEEADDRRCESDKPPTSSDEDSDEDFLEKLRNLNLVELMEACDIDDVISEFVKDKTPKKPTEPTPDDKCKYALSDDYLEKCASKNETKPTTANSTCKESSKTSFPRRFEFASKDKKLIKSKPRICINCFEDLRYLPENAPCPRCECKSDKISGNSEDQTEKSKCNFSFNLSPEKSIRRSSKNSFKCFSSPEKLKKKCKKYKVDLSPYARVLQQRTRSSKKCKFPRCNKVFQLRLQYLKNKKAKGRYAYQFLNKHPGMLVGHQWCALGRRFVPKDMGWLWNLETEKGWCPGAVRRPVARIMKQFLNKPKEKVKIELPPKPMLSVKKQRGEYAIVMNPTKDSKENPVVFKITKGPELAKKSEARRMLKLKGVTKSCTCKSLEACKCRTTLEKEKLKCQLKDVSERFCMKKSLTFSDLDESSDSEIDIKFTPPIGKGKCEPKIMSYASTQYNKNDLKLATEPIRIRKSERKGKAGTFRESDCEIDDEECLRRKAARGRKKKKNTDDMYKGVEMIKPKKSLVTCFRERCPDSCVFDNCQLCQPCVVKPICEVVKCRPIACDAPCNFRLPCNNNYQYCEPPPQVLYQKVSKCQRLGSFCC